MIDSQRTLAPRRRTACSIALASALALSSCALPSATPSSDPKWEHGRILVPVGSGTASIDPATLQVDYLRAGGVDAWSGPSVTALGTPTAPTIDSGAATWSFADSDLIVTVATADGRLNIELVSPSDRSVSWPVTTGPGIESIEFPNGDGLSVPVEDPFWQSEGAGLLGSTWDFAGGLTLPFWGATFDDGGVSYIVHSDIGTALSFRRSDGRIEAVAEHAFSSARATNELEISFAPTDGTIVAAGKDYRNLLLSSGGIVTLQEKINANPATEALVGALHAYSWGDGRDAAIVQRLQGLGIDRAWLGYAGGSVMSSAAVEAAQSAGFLVGPYDTWDNAQAPEDADTPSSIWPGDIWPQGCVTDANGDPVIGFGGRGCYVSTAALDAAQETNRVLDRRVQEFTSNGVSSYFLDVDAAGQLFRDYSPDHPQTEHEDRARRITRMKALAAGLFSNGAPIVLGSETAAGWANPVVSFSHGSSTPIFDGIWALQREADKWGAWWPEDRPGFFFKETELPEQLANAMFNHVYRIPLYQTVLHDSVISTDRWEMGLYKFPALVRERTLLHMLYNSPALVSLDGKVLDEHGEELARMQRFFGFLQSVGGMAPMTAFEQVDGGVQRTVFGDGTLTVTVNFGTTERAGIGAGCAIASSGDDERSFCVTG